MATRCFLWFERDTMRFLLIFFIVLIIALPVAFFGYPPLIERTDGVCSALSERVEDVASHDPSGLLIVGKLYGSSSSEPSGAAFAEDRYPLLPAGVGCAIAYWKAAFDPPTAPAPPPLSPPKRRIASVSSDRQPGRHPLLDGCPRHYAQRRPDLARDHLQPCRWIRSPFASIIRNATPGRCAFSLLQGKTVMSPCVAQRGAPGTAWCKFDGELRKGSLLDLIYRQQRAPRAISLYGDRTVGGLKALDAPAPRPYLRRPQFDEAAAMPAYQYIYVMKGLGKSYPGGREVLRDIWLSFLPGAKIGVLGPQRRRQIDAAAHHGRRRQGVRGEAWAAEGARVGFLPQEPVLDPDKDVFGNVSEGLAETKALVERFEAVSARFAEELSRRRDERR